MTLFLANRMNKFTTGKQSAFNELLSIQDFINMEKPKLKMNT